MKDRGKWITILDKLFSACVRLRDMRGNCITCNTPFKGKYDMVTCGHFRKRRHLATRWNLSNGYGQCAKCNMEDDYLLFEEKLTQKIGAEAVEEIIRISRIDMHYTDEDFEHIYKLLTKYKDDIS